MPPRALAGRECLGTLRAIVRKGNDAVLVKVPAHAVFPGHIVQSLDRLAVNHLRLAFTCLRGQGLVLGRESAVHRLEQFFSLDVRAVGFVAQGGTPRIGNPQ